MAERRTRASAGKLYIVFVAVFQLAAILVGLADPFFLKAMRLIGFDQMQRLAPAAMPVTPAVFVIDVDEESLARLGQWPWPRSRVGALVDKLAEHHVAAIAFDATFAEPDRTSLEEVVKTLPPDRAVRVASELSGLRTNDAVFADAMARAPTVLGVTLTQDQRPGSGQLAKAGIAVAGDSPLPFLYRYNSTTTNLPVLTKAAAGIGAVNWVPDRDQIVRRVPLLFRYNDEIVPSLAAEALRVAQGAGTYVIKSSNASGETAFGRPSGVNHVRIGAFDIPTDADSGLWLHFHKVDRASFIPAWQALEDARDLSGLEGHIVLIGTSAAGLSDLRATPLEEAVPGVAIHQLVLEHIMTGRFLTRPDFARSAELVLALVLGVALAALFPFISAQLAALSVSASIFALVMAAWWLFHAKGLLFDPLYPSASLFLLGTTASFYLYRRTEIQRQEIRRAFGRYVSPDVVEALIANPEKLSLGGELRPLSLLFCDVRGFTQISEGLTASELTGFINRLFTPLSDIILKHGGTIDKFMGDAIMAFWNAPLDDEDHARKALEAGTDILREIAALNASWKRDTERAGRKYIPVRLGVGVNTGECCVGNLGSTQRFDYSAIGDEVNVASRFENLTKLYAVGLLTGEATQKLAPSLPLLEVDLVRVKGRDTPSRLFTLMSIYNIPPSDYTALRLRQNAMLTAYRDTQWDKALDEIEHCRRLANHELNGLYDLFRTRIATYKISPPSPGWGGVFSLEEK